MDKNRGSQFRKWDLHVHSLYSHSHLSNQYKINEKNHEECFDKFLKKIKDSSIGFTINSLKNLCSYPVYNPSCVLKSSKIF